MYLFLHVLCSCLFHAYVSSYFFLFAFVCDVFSLFLPISLSRINHAWHLSANPLWLGTLVVLGLLLLIFPFLLFTFSSVMGRPNRTSLRTFRNVAFIRSAMLFCRTCLTLLFPVSFGLGAGNLFVRYPWGVSLCLYRSFTPIYTISILLYFGLPWHFEVHLP